MTERKSENDKLLKNIFSSSLDVIEEGWRSIDDQDPDDLLYWMNENICTIKESTVDFDVIVGACVKLNAISAVLARNVILQAHKFTKEYPQQ